jgi:hypothetical protein
MLNFSKLLTKNKRKDLKWFDGEVTCVNAGPGAEESFFEKLFKRPAPLIHKDDRRLVGNFLKPNLEQGPWIAGGAPLRWYQNLSVGDHDIDVFFANQQQFDELSEIVTKRLSGYILFNSEHALTLKAYVNNLDYKVQLIKKFRPSLADLLDNFDITVCKIATDGEYWVKGQDFDRDLAARALVLHNELRPDSIKRVVKYMLYGYEPSNELLDQIYNNADLQVKFSDDEDYRM